MPYSHLTTSHADLWAGILDVLAENDISFNPLNTGYTQTLAGILNAIDDDADASHLMMSEGQLLAALLNALDADAHASHLTMSVGELLAGIRNSVEDGLGARVTFSGSATVPEDTAVSSSLGTFAVTGGSGTYTFTITSGNGAGKFDLVDDELLLDGALDYETTASYALVIEADNGVDPVLTLNLTINVGDIDEVAPTITSANSGNNPENTVLAHALTANESVTWSIIGGTDQARFELSGSTLRWASNGTKDYETPNDSDTNNTYVVQVRATDTALNTADQTITITVTDVDEIAPTVSVFSPVDGATGVVATSNLTVQFSENVSFHTAVVITLRLTSDDSIVETFDETDIAGTIAISGDTLTINPTSAMADNTSHYVLIGATSIKDAAGNFFAGISSKTTWNFTSASVGSTWNPSDKDTNITLADSDLTAKATSASYGAVRATSSKSSGKSYFEVAVTSLVTGNILLGIGTSATPLSSFVGSDSTGWSYFSQGQVYHSGDTLGSITAYDLNDVIGVAVDKDNDRLYFAKNNTWVFGGDPAAGTGGIDISAVNGTAVFPMFSGKTDDWGAARFSAGNSYSPPTGFTLWG